MKKTIQDIIMNDIATHKQDNVSIVSTDTEQTGWGFFSDDISWFLFDFFSKQLNPTQKLIFYSYYITGMTLENIAEIFHCSHQAIHKKIEKMNGMLSHSWQYLDRWREDE